MSAQWIRSSTLLLLGLGLASCADLPPFERGVCGNGVVEPEHGEACDLFAGEGLACGAPEDTAHACHFTCGAEQAGCPAGWACGGDGTCRFASGAFESHVISGRFLGEVEHLSSGDFDGDGRTDLFALTRGAISLRYGADGQLGTQFDLPFPSVGAPAIADLDADGRSDVVVPQSEGLVVFRGETDQTLHPVPSLFSETDGEGASVQALPVLARGGPELEALLVIATSAVGICASLTTDLKEACTVQNPLASPALFSAPRPGARLGAVRERLVEGESLRELAFAAVEGEPSVFVFEVSACPDESSACLQGPRQLVSHPKIQLDAGGLPPVLVGLVETTGQLMLADHDGDGRNDLLIGVRFNGPLPPGLFNGTEQPRDGVLVAYRTDAGLATPVFEPAFTRLSRRAVGSEEHSSGSAWPLAGANLDLDPRADYVGAEGVFRWDGSNMYQIADPSLGPWSEAVIADLNRDGLPDVSASFEEVEGIEFLQGTGLPVLNPTLITTRGKARLLRAGDFDGDLVLDLSFVDRVPKTSGMGGSVEVEGRIKISFGGLQGPPSDPVDIGPLPGIVDLVPAYSEEGDLIADLLVEGFNPETGKVSMAKLTGTTRRRMFSVLVPPGEGAIFDPDGNKITNQTLGVRVGSFDSVGSGFDILAVRRTDQWLFSGAGNASFPSELMSQVDLAAGSCNLSPPLDPACAVVTTGRLRNEDTVDSVVAFENLAGCSNGAQTARLTVLQEDPTSGPGAVRCWSTEVGVLQGGVPSQASLIDLNGVGSPELVVVYGVGEVARGRGQREGGDLPETPTEKSESGLAVYWNLGGVTEGPPITSGDLGGVGQAEPASGEDPAAFASADVVGAGSYSEEGNVDMDSKLAPDRPNQVGGLVPGFLATSPIVADVDVERELLVLTTDGLFVMDFSGNPEVPLLRPVRWEVFGQGDRIHTTDLDQDGLLDIVISRGADFEVLRSIPLDHVPPEVMTPEEMQ